MSVSREVENFSGNSLAENNKQLFSQIKDLVSAGSLENLKCSNSKGALDQQPDTTFSAANLSETP